MFSLVSMFLWSTTQGLLWSTKQAEGYRSDLGNGPRQSSGQYHAACENERIF